MQRNASDQSTGQPNAELVIKVLDVAYEQRGRPQNVMFDSNQGSQYVSRNFRQRLWRYRMSQSMSRRDNRWDNAPMERLFRSLESEWIPTTGYSTFNEAQRDISYYLMTRYNWLRPHTMVVWYLSGPKKNLNHCPESVNQCTPMPSGAFTFQHRNQLLSHHQLILGPAPSACVNKHITLSRRAKALSQGGAVERPPG